MTNKKKEKTTEDRIAELENNWKRALADYQNLQKRVGEEREVLIRFSNATLILRLLPVLDNLQLLAKHTKDEGVLMTIKEFEKVLEEEDVKEIEADGKKFNAEEMDAVEMIKGKPGIVMEIVQKGYMLNNKILRPARVRVGQKEEK
jgi:molecular chaperone GrpE